MNGGIGTPKTSLLVRAASEKDLDGIVKTNRLSLRTEKTNGLIQERTRREFAKLLAISKYFIVTESNGEIVGYAIILDEDAPYSENEIFSFYPIKYKNFVFIDQVAVRPDHRRKGVAKAMYGRFLSSEKKRVLVDFLVEPRNDESMAFHEAMGFKSIGDFIKLKNGMRAEVYEHSPKKLK